MQFRHFRPPEFLKDIVWCFWTLEGGTGSDQPFINNPPASSLINLLFHYKGKFEATSSNGQKEGSFRSGIHAQTDKYRQIRITGEYGIFGVFLYPYAIRMLLGIPAAAITNQLPDLFSILGPEANAIEERIMLAENNQERINILCSLLRVRLKGYEESRIIRSLQYVYEQKGMTNINRLADQTFLSVRQFERKFKEYSGFSPKKFSRIVRFNALIGNYHEKYASLSQMAYDFGYSDQSHFIEEFREFSGTNPKRFFSNLLESGFHTP